MILTVVYAVALFPIFHPFILQRRLGVYYILGFTPEVLRSLYKIIKSFSEELKIKGIDVTIFDHALSRTNEVVIYKSFEKTPEILLFASTSIDVGERVWTIKFEQT